MKLKPILIGGIVVMLAVLGWYQYANAADLGGNCCSDLEDRIAELEATTARKGTKKVSLNIYGQVNKAILYYDIEDVSDTRVIENGASETFVGFAAKVQINKDFAAGGVVELGQGRTYLHVHEGFFEDSIDLATNNDIYTRQSYVFLSTPAGRVSVGLQSMATDDFTVPSVANTDASTKRLTLQPLGGIVVSHWFWGTLLDAELEPFNGKKAEAIRYDSPVFAGFSASAAWESGSDSWDAAIRYAGELGGFTVIGAIGYEVDKADEIFGSPVVTFFLGDTETRTLLVNGGVKHNATGIFAQGSWAELEIDPETDPSVKTEAWHVQAGWEGKLFAFGTTTVWGGWLEWEDLSLTSYELGINQNIGGGADLYLVGKQYELGDIDGTSILGGMRLRY